MQMTDEPAILPVDVGQLGDWLEGDRPIAELREELSFPCDDDTQAFLEQVRRGLADVEAGQVVATEEMMRELESRRRARRAAA